VFLLCASSFVIVLTFGGPQATTLEVAIYQSLRMDFDVSRALTLTVLQMLLSAVLVWAAARVLLQPDQPNSTLLQSERFDGTSGLAKLVDFWSIGILTLFIVPILTSVLWQGLQHLNFSSALFTATGTSLGLALLTCFITLPLAWALSQTQLRAKNQKGSITALSLASYIVPPAVLSTGWFLAFRSWDGGVWLAVALIAVMNGLMALPFVMTVLVPAMTQAASQHDRLCAQLDLRGWRRFKLVDVPSLRGPIAQAILMALVLSMGDLTAVTLLGTQGLLTLPSLVQQQMGHYQSDAAGSTALVLATICVVLTLLAQRLSRWT
jgi:thiamine transport system permease protein